jgi:hypothetical protein
MKRTIWIFASLLLAAACKPEGRQTQRAPQTVDEFTQVIIREVREVIRDTDAQLVGRPPKTRQIAEQASEPGYRLELWVENERPVKLTATPAEGAAPTAYYFANGELFFAAQPTGKFIFINGALKYWLGENWEAQQGGGEEQQSLEAALLQQAQIYLQAFN